MRKLLWTVLATAVSTACAAAAVRGLAWAWRKVAKENPPDMPGWGFLIGKPLTNLVRRAVHPGVT
jgi:hypothetical protein